MKKLLKSLLAIAAAFLMVFSLGTAVNADDTTGNINVTIQNSDGNTASGTYIAYKLFNVTAQLKEGRTTEKTYKYSIVDTDSNHNADLATESVYTTLGLKSTDESTNTKIQIAEEVLSKLSNLADTDPKVVDFANALGKQLNGKNADKSAGDVEFTLSSASTTASLAPGYYIVLEKVSNDNESYTAAILNTAVAADTVNGEITLTSKESTPTVEKKVEETNDTAGTTAGWQDAADYDGGDKIKYRLKGTLPSDYDRYDKYTYTFNDTLSKGLDVDETSIKVYAVDSSSVQTAVETEDLLKTYTDITGYFKVNIYSYTAGTETSYANGKVLTISCADLKAADSNKKIDESGNAKEKNVLNSKTAIIVRYTATLNKDNAVIGAAGNPNEVTLTYSNNPNATGEGSTHTTPRDKVTVFTYQVVVNKTDDQGKALKGAEFTLEKLDSNGDPLKQIYTYSPSNNGTTFTFKNLDAGTYRLHESIVPDGYKAAPDTTFNVEAEYQNNVEEPKLKRLVVKDSAGNEISTTDQNSSDTSKIFYIDTQTGTDANNNTIITSGGTMTTTVKNTPGSKLPSTGGIGTTIFYVCGGSLVAIAAVLLISKKRASAE